MFVSSRSQAQALCRRAMRNNPGKSFMFGAIKINPISHHNPSFSFSTSSTNSTESNQTNSSVPGQHSALILKIATNVSSDPKEIKETAVCVLDKDLPEQQNVCNPVNLSNLTYTLMKN